MKRFLGSCLLILIASLLACSTGPGAVDSSPQVLDVRAGENTATPAQSPILRIATLNIAHGRGESLNQMLVTNSTIENNLAAIADFLQQQGIHIAALQEVDAPSHWSGNMDQAGFIARRAGYPWWVQASHASLGIADYGTAVLSTLPIHEAMQVDFPPSPPTAQKGFTLAQIQWQPDEQAAVAIDVISIHMDFSRKSVRRQQLEKLDLLLRERRNPLILMGDFNSEYLASRLMESAAEDERHLHTWAGGESPHFSYKKKRLDWIIVSGDLEFVDYTTASEPLSDHKAVIASLRLTENSGD